VLGDDPVETVLVAAPGSAGTPLVGDGTLSIGRVATPSSAPCPPGRTPDQVMQALANFDPERREEPQLPTAGPPHIVHGMFAELIVG
jgi:hypothetical protein